MANVGVLITGASKGIGKALGEELLSRGYRVYAAMRNPTVQRCNYTPVALDLLSPESIESCAQTILKEDPNIAIIVHNAGIAYRSPVEGLSLQEVHDVFQTNLFGPLRLTQLLLPAMRSNRKGKIVFMGSIRGVESDVYSGVYAASKAAIESVAFDLAVSLSQWDITVSVLDPGPIITGGEIFSGSYFSPGHNPYPPLPPLKFEWQELGDLTRFTADFLQMQSPPFRSGTNEYSSKVLSKHLKDPSGQAYLQERKAWYLQTRS